MVKGLIAGERPEQVLRYASKRLKARDEELLDALDGELTAEHRFVLSELMEHIEDLDLRPASGRESVCPFTPDISIVSGMSPGDNLLANARLAADQDRRLRVAGDARELALDALHRRRQAEACLTDLVPHRAWSAGQVPKLGGQRGRTEGLGQVVGGPELEQPHGVLDGAIDGDEETARRGSDRLEQPREDLDAGNVRQADVDERNIGTGLGQGDEPLASVTMPVDRVPFHVESLHQGLAHDGVVLGQAEFGRTRIP
jgi:hypothetical protein